jgi:ADP-ribose pyrophosphatase
MNAVPRTVESRRVFEGKVFDVRVDRVEYDDASAHRVDVVEHGASIAVAATTGSGELILVRQYRHPTGGFLWEIPAGSCEPGEAPLEAARRELREETGYAAERLTKVGSFWMTPGFCSEVMYLFHADGLTEGLPALDEDERIETGKFSLETAWRLVAEGLADAKTLLALYWLQGGQGEIGGDPGR